jgi:anti-sigma factor RsiW
MSDEHLVAGSGASGAHVGSEELAFYVIGALGPAERDAVERHVFACDVCAERLAREARLEAALEQVAALANERPLAPVVPIAAASRPVERARLAAAGRGSRWAGGVAGALAAAAAVVLVLASTTAHSEPAVGIAQRAPAVHDAAGDMSGAFGGEVVLADALDGG